MLLRGNQPSREEQEHRHNATQTVIAELDQLLGPYIASEEAVRRVKDLEMLCDRAAKVGRVLVSQPARWEFSWSHPDRMDERGSHRSSRARLVVFPSLLRLTDDVARNLKNPRAFLDPRVL
jgi:hypothetical protein